MSKKPLSAQWFQVTAGMSASTLRMTPGGNYAVAASTGLIYHSPRVIGYRKRGRGVVNARLMSQVETTMITNTMLASNFFCPEKDRSSSGAGIRKK